MLSNKKRRTRTSSQRVKVVREEIKNKEV